MRLLAPGITSKEVSADQKSLQKNAQQDQASQRQVESLRPASSHRRVLRSYLHSYSFSFSKIAQQTMIITAMFQMPCPLCPLSTIRPPSRSSLLHRFINICTQSVVEPHDNNVNIPVHFCH